MPSASHLFPQKLQKIENKRTFQYIHCATPNEATVHSAVIRLRCFRLHGDRRPSVLHRNAAYLPRIPWKRIHTIGKHHNAKKREITQSDKKAKHATPPSLTAVCEVPVKRGHHSLPQPREGHMLHGERCRPIPLVSALLGVSAGLVHCRLSVTKRHECLAVES
ncbi:hypothetical protein TcG_10455 [Trypanosoma cruzi]|nr:hypothetical protein TcG_10455 [Trypanosoma cruzi]